MVDTAVRGQILVRMAINAVDRIDAVAVRDDVYHIRSCTVMAGGAGTDPVGRNIVLDGFDFSPVCDNMAGAAELPRCIIGKVIGADFHGVLIISMVAPLVSVTVGAGDLRAIDPLLNKLPDE